jgi:hypothetical protein
MPANVAAFSLLGVFDCAVQLRAKPDCFPHLFSIECASPRVFWKIVKGVLRRAKCIHPLEQITLLFVIEPKAHLLLVVQVLAALLSPQSERRNAGRRASGIQTNTSTRAALSIPIATRSSLTPAERTVRSQEFADDSRSVPRFWASSVSFSDSWPVSHRGQERDSQNSPKPCLLALDEFQHVGVNRLSVRRCHAMWEILVCFEHPVLQQFCQ